MDVDAIRLVVEGDIAPTTGSSASQAAEIPSTLSLNCHMTSGFSGFPKFQVVDQGQRTRR